MIDRRSVCRISIGSSIVTTCLCIVRLMWSTIAPSVVLFPEPVVPVTRMMPRSSSARALIAGGRLSSCDSGTLNGTARMTSDVDPRWRNALTRKRPRPSRACEKSAPPVSSNSRSFSGYLSSISFRNRSVSSGRSAGAFGIRSSFPWMRSAGGAGTLRWMSLASMSMA